ncbi:hypothetical protein AAHB53_01150 [Niallia circulans]
MYSKEYITETSYTDIKSGFQKYLEDEAIKENGEKEEKVKVKVMEKKKRKSSLPYKRNNILQNSCANEI